VSAAARRAQEEEGVYFTLLKWNSRIGHMRHKATLITGVNCNCSVWWRPRKPHTTHTANALGLSNWCRDAMTTPWRPQTLCLGTRLIIIAVVCLGFKLDFSAQLAQSWSCLRSGKATLLRPCGVFSTVHRYLTSACRYDVVTASQDTAN